MPYPYVRSPARRVGPFGPCDSPALELCLSSSYHSPTRAGYPHLMPWNLIGFSGWRPSAFQREVWAVILGTKRTRIQERVCPIQPLFALGGQLSQSHRSAKRVVEGPAVRSSIGCGPLLFSQSIRSLHLPAVGRCGHDELLSRALGSGDTG